MKLLDLVSYFRQGGTFEDFCNAQNLDVDSEVIEVYAQEPVNLNSQLGFFPIEESAGRVHFARGEAKYQNLFDFFYFLGAIEESKGRKDLGDAELAQRLLTYALRDA